MCGIRIYNLFNLIPRNISSEHQQPLQKSIYEILFKSKLITYLKNNTVFGYTYYKIISSIIKKRLKILSNIHIQM